MIGNITSGQLKIINYLAELANGYNDKTFQSLMSEYPGSERTELLDNVYISLLAHYYSNRKDLIVLLCSRVVNDFYNGKLLQQDLSHECIICV